MRGVVDSCSVREFARIRQTQDELSDFRGDRRRQWFYFENPRGLPNWPCCYVIYCDFELVYIGQTSHLNNRIRTHIYRQLGPKMAEGYAITVKAKLGRRYGDWAMTELRLIKRLKPCGNHRQWNSRQFFEW